jgi:hypothetical protein
MNTTLKLGKLTLAAVLGSLLWAGCASTANEQTAEQPGVEQTVDVGRTGPQTNPAYSSGLYDPYQSEWSVESIE